MVSTAVEALEPRGGPDLATLGRCLLGAGSSHLRGRATCCCEYQGRALGPRHACPHHLTQRLHRKQTCCLHTPASLALLWGPTFTLLLRGAGERHQALRVRSPPGSRPILWPPQLSIVPPTPASSCAEGHPGVPDHPGLGTQAPPPIPRTSPRPGPWPSPVLGTLWPDRG